MRQRSVVVWSVLLLASVTAALAERDEMAVDIPNIERSSFWSRLEPEWYGYVKLDVAYDGSRTAPGCLLYTSPSPRDPE